MTMKDHELRELVNRLCYLAETFHGSDQLRERFAIELKAAFKQPEQEPVAWGFQNTAITGSNRWMYLRETIPTNDQYRGALWTPLYTAPPKQPWVGLTVEEVIDAWAISKGDVLRRLEPFARAIEAKLKEKNNG